MPAPYPVLEILPQLRKEFLERRIIILQAPPGSGKSTVLPLHLLDEPWLCEKRILMLEPRRLAARSVAGRMATLRKEDVGETVGYRIRFESNVSARTRIEVVTEGILTRRIQSDIGLEGIGLVISMNFMNEVCKPTLHLHFVLKFRGCGEKIYEF
jgi:ATP-dependent helicase HrpB